MSDTTVRQPQQEAPSLLGPIILIAVGIYFLLYNAGILPSFNWWALLRFWPLILIFAGVNVLVRQLRQPFGSLLSLLVGLVAIATFGYLVFFTVPAPPRWQPFNWGQADFHTDHVAFPADAVARATVAITTDLPGLNLYAVEDSNQLVEGDVAYFDELIFETSRVGDEAKIVLDTDERQAVGLFNPSNWGNLGTLTRWEVGLNGRIPTDLSLHLNANASDLDLRQLELTRLRVEANASRVALLLPDGVYNGRLETNAGSMELTLSEQGRQELEVAMSAGNLSIRLPANRAVQMQVERSLGSFGVTNGRLTRVSQTDSQEVWQTADFNSATEPIRLQIDIAAGNVHVYSD